MEKATSDANERLYVIEALGDFENDPNLTDKRFPDNPTHSYRSTSPLKIIAELGVWERHSDGEIDQMLLALKELCEQGGNVILS